MDLIGDVHLGYFFRETDRFVGRCGGGPPDHEVAVFINDERVGHGAASIDPEH